MRGLDWEGLVAECGRAGEDFTPPWGLSEASLLEGYPASYVEFSTVWAARLPLTDNGFRWTSADPEEDRYASLQALREDACAAGLPRHFLPFSEDNGEYWCFDPSGAVVLWEHDAPAEELEPAYPDFVAWLKPRLATAP